MPSGSRECIVSTVFVPVLTGPVLLAYMRNCSGAANAKVPTKVGPGHYQVITPEDLNPLNTSITARAAGALPLPGAVRDVTVVLTRNLPPLSTTIDIYVRDNFGADSDEAYEVEVTLAQLPL